MKRIWLSILAVYLTSASLSAAAERPWSKPVGELDFSAEASAFWDKEGKEQWDTRDPLVWKAKEKAEQELRACLRDQPPDRCDGMLFKAWSLLPSDERAPVVEMMDRVEKAFDVDPLTIANNQRLAAEEETALIGLERLREIAGLSLVMFDMGDSRTARRQLKFAVASWLAGEQRGNWSLLFGGVDKDPATAPLLRLAELSSLAWNAWPFEEWLTKAQATRKEIGPKAASNLALMQLAFGQGPAAEASAREGYDALVAAYGPDDSRTVAAALILARVLADLNKNDAARPYARLAHEARRKDPFATPVQKLDAMQLLAGLVESKEKEGLEAEVLALIEDQLARPYQPPFARFAELNKSSDAELDARLLANERKYRGEAFQRRLLSAKSRLLAAKAYPLITTDVSRARTLLDEAATADPTTIVMIGRAMVRLQETNNPSELMTSREYLNLKAALISPMQPEDHPERIVAAFTGAAYESRIGLSTAPTYARQAAAGAAKRLAQHRELNSDAMSEITSFRPVFTVQVSINWWAAQAAEAATRR